MSLALSADVSHRRTDMPLPEVFRTKAIDDAVILMLQHCNPDDFDDFVIWRDGCKLTADVQEVGRRLLAFFTRYRVSEEYYDWPPQKSDGPVILPARAKIEGTIEAAATAAQQPSPS